MRPIGMRRRARQRAAAEKIRQAVERDAGNLVRAADEIARRSRATDERAIRFADSAWRQIQKIAAARGFSERQAIAEALSVWEAVSPLLGVRDGPIEVKIRGKSCVILVRREYAAQPVPDPLATYPR